MRNPRALLMIATFAVCACVSGASAGPIDFDGDIDLNDSYAFRLEDPAEGLYGTDSFDIDAVEFDSDATWLYIGVDTVGPFDRNGGPTAFPPMTQFLFALDDGSQSHFFMLLIDDASAVLFEGATPLAAGWEAQIGTDLEIRLSNTALLAGFNYENLFFQARLDNSDQPPDDVISGPAPIPEPASIFLLGAAGLAGLKRRRRAA